MRKFLSLSLLSIVLFALPIFVLAQTEAADCTEYCSDPYNVSTGEGTYIPPSGKTCFCSPISYTSIEALIEGVTNWIFYIGIVLAPLMIVIAAFMFMTSAGDPNKVQRAKQIIIWTCIGLAIILFSRGIIALIRYMLGA